jgi:hypothetical protein
VRFAQGHRYTHHERLDEWHHLDEVLEERLVHVPSVGPHRLLRHRKWSVGKSCQSCDRKNRHLEIVVAQPTFMRIHRSTHHGVANLRGFKSQHQCGGSVAAHHPSVGEVAPVRSRPGCWVYVERRRNLPLMSRMENLRGASPGSASPIRVARWRRRQRDACSMRSDQEKKMVEP